jgi:hypothetical protein
VRDDFGDVLAALSEPGVNDGNNTWRMAKATSRAFHFCVDTGFHPFIIIIIILVKSTPLFLNVQMLVLCQDVQRVLGAISFSVINKTCNHITQTLVGFAKEKKEVSIWLEKCPPILSHLY